MSPSSYSAPAAASVASVGELLQERLAFARPSMLLQPRWHLSERARRLEADITAAPVEGEAVLAQGLQYLPRLAIALRRGLEVQPHVDHGSGTVGADDLARDMVQPCLGGPGTLLALLPLPILECLP